MLRNRIVKFVFVLAVLGSAWACSISESVPEGRHDIIILYENDVHCAIEGYAKFAALKNEMKKKTPYLALVSSGDFIQGGIYGSASRGRDVIRLMNAVGYDFVTLGNHEFDYGVPRLQELMENLEAECLCCNFKELPSGQLLYEPCRLVSFGDTQVAFLGISTPYSVTYSTPSHFKNGEGDWIYDFGIGSFYENVQAVVDSVIYAGADYVIALSHLGDESEGENGINSLSLIHRTHGMDVVLDGHAHSVIQDTLIENRSGKKVLLTSTGTGFENMGVLCLSPDGSLRSRLIPTSSYPVKDPKVEKRTRRVVKSFSKVSQKLICYSDVPLRIEDADGKRLVRSEETGIGNLCADACRRVMETDVAVWNGGGIRANLPSGGITYFDLNSVFPFGNEVAVCEISGKLLMDMLELSVAYLPDEFGGFLQVSGLMFDYTFSIPSPVVFDNQHNFVGCEGERRVSHVRVWNRDRGQYEALEPDSLYSLSGSAYLLRDYGNGYTMFKEAIDVRQTGLIDKDVVEQFVSSYLHKKIGTGYARPQGRMNLIKNLF